VVDMSKMTPAAPPCITSTTSQFEPLAVTKDILFRLEKLGAMYISYVTVPSRVASTSSKLLMTWLSKSSGLSVQGSRQYLVLLTTWPSGRLAASSLYLSNMARTAAIAFCRSASWLLIMGLEQREIL
jgi:hypothetical protein